MKRWEKIVIGIGLITMVLVLVTQFLAVYNHYKDSEVRQSLIEANRAEAEYYKTLADVYRAGKKTPKGVKR
jgi:hypothetical protein